MRKILLTLCILQLIFCKTKAQCFTQISTGYNHVLAVKFDGTLWAWGKNNCGQLGDGTKTNRWTQTQIGSDHTWKTVSAGNEYSLAIKTDGTLWAWGKNQGNLGDGSNIDKSSPVKIGFANNWKKISAGTKTSYGIKNDSTIWAWGDNTYGQYGNGTIWNFQNYPIQIGTAHYWKDVCAGNSHVTALATTGKIFVSGYNGALELGIGQQGTNIATFTEVGSGNWKSITTFDNQTIALKNDSTLWGWGLLFGQPSYHTSLDLNHVWTYVSTGILYTLAIKADGTLWGRGSNPSGNFGDGTTVAKLIFTKIGNDTNWQSVKAGYFHTIGVKKDGSIYTWGRNTVGQLGIGDSINRHVPTFLSCPLEAPNRVRGAVFAANNNNCMKEVGEFGLPNVLITANPKWFGTYTDTAGKYTLETDTGFYIIKPLYPPYYASFLKSFNCPSNELYNVQLSRIGIDTTGFNFSREMAVVPLLQVEFTQFRMRRCFENKGLIKYCNLGTRDTDNVKITIVLPSDVSFISASKTCTVNGKTLTFNIGSLKIGECGTIDLITKVDCMNGITGQTRCFKVAITPSNTSYINFINKTGYDSSKVSTDAICLGNNIIKFKITNEGKDMTDSSTYRIFQDALLGLTSKYKLKANQSDSFKINATGHTYRIEADQSSLYPVNSNPNTSIENCGGTLNSHIGFITKLPPYEENMEYKEYCIIIRDSYDPNDKSVTPVGVGTGKIVKHKVPLNYAVNFQNTGNDTAYKVVVIDTLSNRFDLSTLQIGGASHPYKLKITGENSPILNFIFDNIYLVDSTTNEKGSHGFLSYRVMPYDTIADGTIIKNTADIYFDYNIPVRTNTTMNTIDDRLPTTAAPIEIRYPSYDSINIVSCNSFKSPSGKYIWTISGIYKDTLMNYIGEDSIITITLKINNSSARTLNITACNSYKSPSGKFIWSNTNTYKDTIQNYAGCDSIITVNLIINYLSSGAINKTVCKSFKSPSGKYNWTASGLYKDTIQNKAGCDSIISINLTVNNSSSSSINVTSCKNYLSPSGKYIWKYSNSYVDTIANSKGCDSVIQVNLTINNINTSISRVGNIFSSNVSGAGYRWVICPSYAFIPGATNQSYTATANGEYAVIITQNNCEDTSACATVSGVGILNYTVDEYIEISPNPNKGTFNLIVSVPVNKGRIEIYNCLGSLVFMQESLLSLNTIELINQSSGIYFIKVYVDNNVFIQKIVLH